MPNPIHRPPQPSQARASHTPLAPEHTPDGPTLDALTRDPLSRSTQAPVQSSMRLALVVAWCREEPRRTGEVLLIPPEGGTLGRGDGGHLSFVRQRPGWMERRPVIENPRISRQQLVLKPFSPKSLHVQNVGRCAMRVNGREVAEASLEPGMRLELHRELLLIAVLRPLFWPADPLLDPRSFSFGFPDEDGLLGESPALWSLRRELRLLGEVEAHTLVFGESGTGKEKVAQALHRHSRRAQGPMVARNAATLPETLFDAELFGHEKGFPQAGMPERPGLLGEAQGGVLFLDEVGDLPASVQPHLLRVLDSGEYQRLGSARMRRADIRLIGATHRPPEQLRHDLLARFKVQLSLPPLSQRLEDVPLLAYHLLELMAERSPAVAEWREKVGPQPFSHRAMHRLLTHPFKTHVRELEGLLWRALQHQLRDNPTQPSPLELELELELEPPSGHQSPIGLQSPVGQQSPLPPRSSGDSPLIANEVPPALEPSREQLQALLMQYDGVKEQVWKAAGLKSRYYLDQLLQRHGLEPTRTIDNITREQLLAVLARYGQQGREEAARVLGLKNRFALYRLMDKLGVPREDGPVTDE